VFQFFLHFRNEMKAGVSLPALKTT